jgi:hypothetical protein
MGEWEVVRSWLFFDLTQWFSKSFLFRISVYHAVKLNYLYLANDRWKVVLWEFNAEMFNKALVHSYRWNELVYIWFTRVQIGRTECCFTPVVLFMFEVMVKLFYYQYIVDWTYFGLIHDDYNCLWTTIYAKRQRFPIYLMKDQSIRSAPTTIFLYGVWKWQIRGEKDTVSHFTGNVPILFTGLGYDASLR